MQQQSHQGQQSAHWGRRSVLGAMAACALSLGTYGMGVLAPEVAAAEAGSSSESTRGTQDAITDEFEGQPADGDDDSAKPSDEMEEETAPEGESGGEGEGNPAPGNTEGSDHENGDENGTGDGDTEDAENAETFTLTFDVPKYTEATPIAKGVNRTGGSTRYETSVQMSKRLFPGTQRPDAVFIASGSSYADGLTLGALAAASGGPLLLVQPNAVPAVVEKEIKRLAPQQIYVAGGTGAVSAGVFQKLETLAPNVQRLAGPSRYETAETIAAAFPVGSGAMLATGTSFPDALVASAASVKNGGGSAVLLTRGFKSSEEALRGLQRLKPSAVAVIGGSWSSASLNAIKTASGRTPETISGKDRYATSAAVAKRFFTEGAPTAIYASGADFADAMVAVPASAAYDAPILLAKKNCKPSSVTAATDKQSRVLLVGGTSVLTNGSATETCPVLPAVVSQSGGYYRFNMLHSNQINGYYCGPASAEMILRRLGYTKSVHGVTLSQSNLAKSQYLATDAWGRTAWADARMSKGLNAWTGKSQWVQKAAPNTSTFRSRVSASFTSTGRPVVVDTQEYSGGQHYNGHPSYSTFSHLMPIEGYNPGTDTIIMLDPAEHFYAASKPSFTHNLASFVSYLQAFGMYY